MIRTGNMQIVLEYCLTIKTDYDDALRWYSNTLIDELSLGVCNFKFVIKIFWSIFDINQLNKCLRNLIKLIYLRPIRLENQYE